MTQIPMQSQVTNQALTIISQKKYLDIFEYQKDNQIYENQWESMIIVNFQIRWARDNIFRFLYEFLSLDYLWLFAALWIIFCNTDPALALQGSSV